MIRMDISFSVDNVNFGISSTIERLVSEVALASKKHWDAMLIASSDDLVVLLRSPGLYDRNNSGLGGPMDGIGERKERIGSQDAPTGSIRRFGNRDLHAVDATHLSCAHADQRGVSGQDNGIALDVPDHLPAEGDVVPKLVGHGDGCDGFPSQICRWQRVGLLDQDPT